MLNPFVTHTTPAIAADNRFISIDVLRGLVIVLMALDHVRDYFISHSIDPTDLAQTDLMHFLTRWITHFCAPVFVLLAGTSAGLMRARKSQGELRLFLLTRGLWLLFAEITIISFAWSFNLSGIEAFGGALVIGMRVIWVLGASMIILAVLQWLPVAVVLGIGVLIITGHNLLDPFWPPENFAGETPLSRSWQALHSGMILVIEPFVVIFSYPLLPWVGVMALGFGMAPVFFLSAPQRRRILLAAGTGSVVLFLLLRTFNGYGEPEGWAVQPRGIAMTFASFLNLTKYPPSLQYLLMTLGPAFLFLAFAEHWRGRLVNGLLVFGRVPFFFYIVHLYFIHGGALLLAAWQGIPVEEMLTFNFLFPEGYGVGLFGVYIAWLVLMAVLYFPCAWFGGVKRRRKDWWLSYL